MRIYLIGYMGSGKSKTADSLSRILKFNFADTDKMIEERTGQSVKSIFEKDGEEYFREMEKNILRDTARMNKYVISTGGGTPLYHKNMEWMNDNGVTVYLEANPGLLFHRLAANRGDRPLIDGLNDVELMERITGHLAVRIPIYRQARIVFNAADLNVKQLADKIKLFNKK